MKKIILGIVASLALFTIAFFVLNSYIYREKQGDGLPEDFKNITFRIDETVVTLRNGVSDLPAKEGSASPSSIKYFGNEVAHDVDGDGVEDMVFLITQNFGGSGTFYYVVAAIKKENGYIGSQAMLLGDRIAPQTIEKGGGKIVIVNYADRAAGEPFTTAPSVGKSIWLTLDPHTLQFTAASAAQDIVGGGEYTNATYGISFVYPKAYVLSEIDVPGERKHHVIVLTRKEDLPLPANGEGPPAITIDIFQNDIDKHTTESWIRNTSSSNFKLGEGRLASTTISGMPALSYRWSGLYEGTTIALAQPNWVYAFSVTYFEMGATIVQDFVAVRDSVRVY